VIGHGRRPADGAEENRFKAFELIEPVIRHHLAVLGVVTAVGPVEMGVFNLDAEFGGRCFERAQAFRDHFLADAVAGDDCYFMTCHVFLLCLKSDAGPTFCRMRRKS